MNETNESTETAKTTDVSTAQAETKPAPAPKKTDYAQDAYECFIKNADPEACDADPVKAIRHVFERRASDELKARVAAEGKTAEGAYAFLWDVARKMPRNGNGCHIPPETGYAIAMHYFEDVPASSDWEPALKKAAEAKRKADEAEKRKNTPAPKAREAAKKSAKDAKAAPRSKTQTRAAEKATKRTDTTAQNASDTAELVKRSYEISVGHKLDYPTTPEPVAPAEPVAPPRKPEHPSEDRDRAQGQGFLFDL